MTTMISRPTFKSHFSVHRVPPDFLYFIGESGYRILQGKILYLLAPYLNGANTTDQIAKKLKGLVSAFDVHCGILLLEQEGVIRESTRSNSYLQDALHLDPHVVSRRLSRLTVRIITLDDIDIDNLATALRHIGVRISETAGRDLVVTKDYFNPELERIHISNSQKKRPWMAVKPTGTFVWIGPVFDPPRTPCCACMVRRMKWNREAESIAQTHGIEQSFSVSAPLVPAAGLLAFQLCAIYALKWLTGKSPRTTELISFDLRALQLSKHVVSRIPGCNFCDSSNRRMLPKPVKLKSCEKVFIFDGGHRVAAAEATFRKYEHLISPLTGIVDQVELSYSDDIGLVHSYVAGHLFTSVSGPQALIGRGLKQLAAGKGISPQQARTSALCEALERYSGVFRGDEYRVQATIGELGDAAVHPQLFLNYSKRQYQLRSSSKDRIPAPFDEKRRIDWSPVWSITNSRFKYLPTAYCYYGFPPASDHDFCRADSNGNAAGNTVEEAVLQGFLELVERDATAIWWYNRIARSGVDLESFALPYFPAIIHYYRRLGLEVWMLDVTTDFRIPCFAAIAFSSERNDFLLGFGAHLDASTAAARALTEMNQFLREFINGGSRHVLKLRSRYNKFLRPFGQRRRMQDFSSQSSSDLLKDVTRCVDLARARGLEVLVLDQTRADVGLPVVKVIVPGLRTLWPRFGAGRLYDVPIEMGWLTKRTAEKQLNPGRIVI